MKKRSAKLEPVAKHAKRQEDEAATILAEAQRRVQESEQQLKQLEAFRDEYLEKFRTREIRMGSINQMLDYQAFISKINHGIGQATHTIKLCCQQRDIVKQQWLQRHTRTLALATVVEKYQVDELKQEVYREQLELEEFSRQRFHVQSR